jgi:hypothetical protein
MTLSLDKGSLVEVKLTPCPKNINTCHGFMTGFKRGSAHESEEQWNVRDMRI